MTSKGLDLRSFKIPLGKLASQETFRTRQGVVLSYRIYPAWSDNLIILFHGVGSDSRYMCVLASALAAAGVGTVVTPDFRGHGASLGASDDIRPSQLEIDLEELIIHIKMNRAVGRVTLMGHSLGGGFVLRMAVSETRNHHAGFVALAPYLPPQLGAFQEGFGGWISPDDKGGFSVNMPPVFQTGQEKLAYSQAYLAAATPSADILRLLQERQPPLRVLIGEADEVAIAERQRELFQAAHVDVRVLSGLNHLTIVSKPDEYLSLIS